MARPVTLFTGQWADLPLEVLAKKAKAFGYDGLELACWGDHLDVNIAAEDQEYCDKKKALAVMREPLEFEILVRAFSFARLLFPACVPLRSEPVRSMVPVRNG